MKTTPLPSGGSPSTCTEEQYILHVAAEDIDNQDDLYCFTYLLFGQIYIYM